MYAELQVLSPLVPTRETYFLRYCQHNAEEGTWTIVDFPADCFQNNLQLPIPHYRRRPSGCVIQDMPNGYSRVLPLYMQPLHYQSLIFLKILIHLDFS